MIATLVMAGIALDLSAGPVTGGQYWLSEGEAHYNRYPAPYEGYTIDLDVELIDRRLRSCSTCFFRLGSSAGFRRLTARDDGGTLRARRLLATSSRVCSVCVPDHGPHRDLSPGRPAMVRGPPG